MSDRFNATYRLKLLVLSCVKDMKILTILDNIYHVVGLPFGFLSYQWHRLLGRPYHGIWMAASQGNPFRLKYMAQSIAYLVKDLENRGRPPSSLEFRVLEIGAYAGASAIQWGLALEKHNFKEAAVYSLDPWESYLDLKRNPRWRLRIMNHALASGRIFQLYKRNIKAAGVSAMCRQLVGNSAEILPLLKDNSFDLIYIDGDHEAGAVMEDIKNALPLLKDGGLLCGDDLEMQLSGVDGDFVKRNLDLDMAVDPSSRVAFHPGVTLAIGEFFQRDVPCYEGYWVVQKKGEDFGDVKLDEGPE